MNNAFAGQQAGGAGGAQRPGGGAGAGGVAQITPQMLDQLAQAAARGKLADSHMRAFLELCRTRPDANEAYRREQAAWQQQQQQARMLAAIAAGGGGQNNYSSPQQAPQQIQQPPQQQQPQPQRATTGGNSGPGIGLNNGALTADGLLDLNMTVSRNLSEAQSLVARSQNPNFSDAEREEFTQRAAAIRNRIGPVAVALSKAGLLAANVDTSTTESHRASLENMRNLLARKAANANRTGSPAIGGQGQNGQPASGPNQANLPANLANFMMNNPGANMGMSPGLGASTLPGGQAQQGTSSPRNVGSPAPPQGPNAANKPRVPPQPQNRQIVQPKKPSNPASPVVGGASGSQVPSRSGSTGQQPQQPTNVNGTVNLPPAMQSQYSAIAQQQQQHQANQQAIAAAVQAQATAANQAAASGKDATGRTGTPAGAGSGTATPAAGPSHAPTPSTSNANAGAPSQPPAAPENPAFPAPRASLTGGNAHGASMSAGAVYKPPVNGVQEALGQGAGGSGAGGDAAGRGDVRERESGRVVTKRKIQELIESIDPSERLDPEVEDLCLEIADEFIDSVTRFGCQLAKHRKSDRLECKDIQLHLERAWNIRIPGFANDEIRQSQSRRVNAAPAYQTRVSAVRDAMKRRAGN